MSSTPSSQCDLDLAVLDPHLVGPEPDRAVELVLAAPDVVLPAVPGAGEDVVVDATFAERPVEVEALALRRIELAVYVRERDSLLARLHGADRAGRDVVHAGDRD